MTDHEYCKMKEGSSFEWSFDAEDWHRVETICTGHLNWDYVLIESVAVTHWGEVENLAVIQEVQMPRKYSSLRVLRRMAEQTCWERGFEFVGEPIWLRRGFFTTVRRFPVPGAL